MINSKKLKEKNPGDFEELELNLLQIILRYFLSIFFIISGSLSVIFQLNNFITHSFHLYSLCRELVLDYIMIAGGIGLFISNLNYKKTAKLEITSLSAEEKNMPCSKGSDN